MYDIVLTVGRRGVFSQVKLQATREAKKLQAEVNKLRVMQLPDLPPMPPSSKGARGSKLGV
jgi:hypothetical protein